LLQIEYGFGQISVQAPGTMADKQIYKIDDELLSVLRKELLEDDSFQRLRTIQ